MSGIGNHSFVIIKKEKNSSLKRDEFSSWFHPSSHGNTTPWLNNNNG